MKKYFTLIILALLASMNFGHAEQQESNEKSRIEIERQNINTSNPFERSIFTPIINAFLYPETKVVEIELYDLGEATIQIVDSLGNICIEDFTDTYIPATLLYDASNLNGTYYIVISSASCYAGGTFNL